MRSPNAKRCLRTAKQHARIAWQNLRAAVRSSRKRAAQLDRVRVNLRIALQGLRMALRYELAGGARG